MSQTDKLLVVAALALGIMDTLNVKGPLARFSTSGLAIVLIAVVMLHRGGVLNY